MIKVGPNMSESRERGFTLIEGMLAGVVVAFGLITLSAMQSIYFYRKGKANELTRATNLAADMMERIQFNRANVDSYGGINTTGTCNATLPVMTLGDCNQWKSLLSSSTASGLAGARGTITVGAVGAGGVPVLLNQRAVQVTVSWTGASGPDMPSRNRQYTLTSAIAPE
jgi:type IV pilus assembly protein PilV